jgi:hypothetical protein
MHPNQAVVAVAQHLLIAVWHVLTYQAADKHADPTWLAQKFMRWSWGLTDEQRCGLTSRQFIRLQLMRLNLGADLTHLTYGNTPALACGCKCASADRDCGRSVSPQARTAC